MSVTILQGDAAEVMATLDASSVSACVTDPPYGLRFMGKSWDHGVPGTPYWQTVRRVLKPGDYLLAFGGTRTYHRLTCAIEDAGFEIRDCLSWMYGSGFPKGKGCLKPGWEPIILARKPGPSPWLNIDGCRIGTTKDVPASVSTPRVDRTQWRISGDLATRSGMDPDTGRWPANVVLSHEPECREVGTKRVKGSGSVSGQEPSQPHANVREGGAFGRQSFEAYPNTVTAWECVETCAVRMLDEQSGPLHGSHGGQITRNTSLGILNDDAWKPKPVHGEGYGDTGGASRFYYCAKASTAERGAWKEPAVRLRSNLTDDQRAYVMAELQKAGVDVG